MLISELRARNWEGARPVPREKGATRRAKDDLPGELCKFRPHERALQWCTLHSLSMHTLLLLGLLPLCCASAPKRLVVAVDVGTESLRAAVFDGAGQQLGEASVPHETQFPEAGWAEQRCDDWWQGLGTAVRAAVVKAGCTASDVHALCLATTSCTVVACDAHGVPLRDGAALLWMDARSAPQAAEIMRLGKGDPALSVNCGGDGPISAEWMLPKALWLKQSEPQTWAAAHTVCECQDWMNFMLTGRLVAGGCNVATRWHCDGAAAVSAVDDSGAFAGRPLTLLRRVGLEELADRWPRACVPMGGRVGGLTAEAAAHLVQISVVQP